MVNNKRKIDQDVIKRFRIGLSNHDGNAIEKALVATNKVSPLDLQDLGILYNDRNKNHYYDFFRGRITFPLKDLVLFLLVKYILNLDDLTFLSI